MICFDKETAAAYLSGDLEPEQAERLAVHLTGCATCRRLVEDISGVIDGVRQKLLLLDAPTMEAEIPSVETIKTRATQGSPSPRPWARMFRLISGGVQGAPAQKKTGWEPSFLLPQKQWMRPAVAIMVLVVAFSAFLYVSEQRRDSVVSADEILARAEQATGNARALPDRVVHRAFVETRRNGLEPYRNGDYRLEYWWDNVNNRSAGLRFDRTGKLVEANWRLEDGRRYNFQDYGTGAPRVLVGPTSQEVEQELNRLSPEIQEIVRLYYSQTARPIVEGVSQAISDTERVVADSLAGRKENAVAQPVTLPDGRLAYWVTFESHPHSPNHPVPRWNTCQLIVDRSYQVIEDRRIGHRTDGLLYGITRVLLNEEIFLPDEADPQIFSPGPFPPNTEFRYVSARERVESLKRSALKLSSK